MTEVQGKVLNYILKGTAMEQETQFVEAGKKDAKTFISNERIEYEPFVAMSDMHMVRKAFKVAQAEKPGGSFISFPENIAGAEVREDIQPLKVQGPMPPFPPQVKVEQAAKVISEARFPIVMAGNGVIRNR